MRALTVAAFVVAVVVGAVAHATPSQDLDRARIAFRSGQFNIALPLYNVLLYPSPQLASPDDLAEAYVSLGVCRLQTGDTTGAKREFEKALQIDPNRQLDPLIITDKAAIRLFDDTKADITSRAEREAQKNALAHQREAYEAALKNLRVVEVHPYYLNFVPFGAGQFQNKNQLGGVLFAAGEGVTFATSVGIWFYLVNKYGVNCPHCVATDDAPSVRQLQQLEVGAGIAFLGIYAWSVVDALIHYQPRVQTKGDSSLLPPELREPSKPTRPKKTSVLERMHLGPMATQHGIGIGLGWEN